MESCRRSKTTLGGAKESSSGLLAATEKLQQDLAANQRRSELVQEFLQQYQLSGSEVNALQVRICPCQAQLLQKSSWMHRISLFR